jgi:hypothetical protein
MDKTITLTLPRLFAGQILCLLHEVHIALSSRQSYIPGGQLDAKDTLKLIKYYQDIIDAVERQYPGSTASADS